MRITPLPNIQRMFLSLAKQLEAEYLVGAKFCQKCQSAIGLSIPQRIPNQRKQRNFWSVRF